MSRFNSLKSLIFAGALFAAPFSASAVVVEPGGDLQLQDHQKCTVKIVRAAQDRIRGSGVLVGEDDVLTAGHVGGSSPGNYVMVEDGDHSPKLIRISSEHRHPTADLKLLKLSDKVSDVLEGQHCWYGLADSDPAVGDRVILAGAGLTRGETYGSDDGYMGIGNSRSLLNEPITYAENTLTSSGGFLITYFDNPSTNQALSVEGQALDHDSGGLMGVLQEDGTIDVAAIATNAGSPTIAYYGSFTGGLSINSPGIKQWILDHDDNNTISQEFVPPVEEDNTGDSNDSGDNETDVGQGSDDDVVVDEPTEQRSRCEIIQSSTTFIDAADFNLDGNVNDQDWFDFMNEAGIGFDNVDFNCNGYSNQQDAFEFFNAYFKAI